MVQVHPDPPTKCGAIAQLGERLLCKQEVTGSIPVSSTNCAWVLRRGQCGLWIITGATAHSLKRGELFFNNVEEVDLTCCRYRDVR